MALDKKTRVARLRVNDATFKAWKKAADESGLTLSEWVRVRCAGAEIVALPPKAR